MQKIETKCDGCDCDVSTTTNCVDYRLDLTNSRLPSSGVVTDMMIYPHIEQDCHFCGLSCLRKWLDEKHLNKESDNG